MKTLEKMKEKRTYNTPEIQLIKLDGEISLALESSPPAGPAETLLQINPHSDNIFLKSELG